VTGTESFTNSRR